MERSADTQIIEKAESILAEYCNRLSLESISVFREDGTLLYSSDPSIEQQQRSQTLFEVLDGLASAFEIGVPRVIMVYDDSRCLIIEPMYIGEWGKVEGWIFALGSCDSMKCAGIVEQIRTGLEDIKKDDLSARLEDYRTELQRAFDFPRILGNEFELSHDAAVMLDGDKGFVVRPYGESAWGITTTKSRRCYPEILVQLECLDMTLQETAMDALFPSSMPKPESMKRSIRSDTVLRFFILYSVFLCIVAIPATPLILFGCVFTLVIATSLAHPQNSYVAGFCLSLAGVVLMIASLYSYLEVHETPQILVFMFGVYFLLSAITIIRITHDYRAE